MPWILYDMRAINDVDRATVLEAGGDEEKLPSKRYVHKMFGGGVLYQYDLDTDGETLINERYVWHTPAE